LPYCMIPPPSARFLDGKLSSKAAIGFGFFYH
jgi:hypothetical protein